MGRAIAIATPFFFALIALEYLLGRHAGRPTYRLNDAINSLSLGVMSQVAKLFMRGLTIGIYAAIFARVAAGSWPVDAWWAWVLAIVFYDFCYYWQHRLSHESAVFWASHVVHHQSRCYNLSTALRQTSSGDILGWIFYVPMAVAGVPPVMFGVAAIVDLLYQYWIHTELVGKLGWFDRWFASPSNHRVHHAVNDRYLDRNYGGIFMAWDRLFGTFVEEDEKCVYGTRAPLDSWDPLWANLEVYADLARKSATAPRWRDKLLVWLKPPGWAPVDAPWRKPAFDVKQVRAYDPPISRAARWLATIHLVVAILAAVALLWFADELSAAHLAAFAAGLVVVLWIIGALMQGRLRVRSALLIEAAALGLLGTAVASAAADRPVRMPDIVDDAQVQRAVESARSQFLAGQPFDRFQVTALVEDSRGRWRRGHVQGDALAYPASRAKLPFLVAAVHWCAAQGRSPDCLDQYTRPMIVESDNVAAGAVVDAISGAPNGPVSGADVDTWLERRRYTERVLERAGLLGNQRVLTKTYPTNSGEEPTELEELARSRLGRNAMSPDLAAQLMLAVQCGTIEPQATTYMRSLLRRPTVTPYSSLGTGLPPGSIHENKIGDAFDTLEDIMYARLPNGRRLIIAAFSNGWDPREAEPWDVARLGRYTELLIRHLGVDRGLPRTSYLYAVRQPAATRTGHWTPAADRGALAGADFLLSEGQDGESFRWDLQVPSDGRYEIAVWYPTIEGSAPSVNYEVSHAQGITRVGLNQTTWGSRWIKLGDFDFTRAAGSVTITGAAPGRLAADAVRVARWPAQLP